jgi:hypothetical protein
VEHRNQFAAENRGLPGEVEPAEPWYRHPWEALDPWKEIEEEKLPGIPMTIGPASGGPAGPASGVDLQSGRMAAELHWEVRKQSAESK